MVIVLIRLRFKEKLSVGVIFLQLQLVAGLLLT